ncbi:MAG: FecCD family ABC transporter permease [Chloroflexota bacterium]
MRLSEQRAAMPLGLAARPSSHRWVRPTLPLVLAATGVLLVSMLLSATQGAVPVPAVTVWHVVLNQVPFLREVFWPAPSWTAAQEAVVLQIRLPRVLLAGVVGASLAVAGATYQGMFRNPLADPYLIGVTAGAGLGAILALALPLSSALYGVGAVQWFAFAGALGTVAIVAMLARVGNTTPLSTLLLAGIALGSLATAISSLIMSVQQDKLHTMYAWLLGGFSLGGWQQVLAVLPHAALGIVVSNLCAGRLNVLQLDEEQAAQLGVNVERLKIVLLGAATLATAAAVSVSGLIGFVGLIVPHAVRLIWGPNYRLLLPLSTLLGATFLVWADTLARTVLAPSELPVGVVTAICGAPFFLYILRQRKRMML